MRHVGPRADVSPTGTAAFPVVERVVSVTGVASHTRTIRIAPVDGDPAPFAPGQFAMLGVFGIGETAASIASDPDELGHREYTVTAIDDATGALVALEPGATIWSRGPFGRPWDLSAADDDLVIAVGSAHVPLVRAAVIAALRTAVGRRRVSVILGRSPTDVPPGDVSPTDVAPGDVSPADVDVERWRGAGAAVVALPDDDLASAVDELADDLVDDPATTRAMVATSSGAVRAIVGRLVDAAVPLDHVQVGLDHPLPCGTGQCGRCQLGPLMVCRDGPIVTAATALGALAMAAEVPD